MEIAFHRGLSALVERYDGLILDVWGVLHDGGPAFPAALEVLKRLADRGTPVVLASNAPRRAARVAQTLGDKGIGAELYRRVVTSGDALRAALGTSLSGLAKSYCFLGPEADGDLLDDLEFKRVARPADAAFILGVGFVDVSDEIAVYESLFREGIAHGLPFLCANPDRMVFRQGVAEPCAGLLAERYAELGGEVHHFGKPHPPVYRVCLEHLGIDDPKRVLAVGDGLETDIAGAKRMAFDSLLITDGLLAGKLGADRSALPGRPLPGRLAALCREADAFPSAVMARLVW